MKKIQLVGVALVAMFAFSIVSAGTALAATPEWLDNGAPITTAVKVDSEGTLILTDLKAPLGAVEIECKGTDEGTVGPGKADTETKVTATECKTLKGSCASPLAEALKLNWTTSLELVGTEWRDPITSESGWKVLCSGIISDECTSAAKAATIIVLLAEGKAESEDPVHIEFVAGAANEGIATCSLGGAKAGDVTGLLFVLASEPGHLITVS